jgi:hypothetical protein
MGAALAAVAVAAGDPVDPRPPGTLRMVARLERLAAARPLATDPYRSADRAAYYREWLDRGLAGNDEVQARLALADELLRAGDPGEAVVALADLRDRAARGVLVLRADQDRLVRETTATAWLRLGEQQNCVAHRGAESCVWPIRGSGLHRDTRGSRAAMGELLALLERRPGDGIARWLLNIVAMTVGEHPHGVPARWLVPDSVLAAEADVGRFHDVAGALDLNVVSHSGGSIAEDFDGDGFLDLMVSSSGPLDQLRYFRSAGDGTFVERTREAGLLGLTGGLNIVHADYDNDGAPDLLVLRGGWLGTHGRYPNSLLRNRGDGTFEDVTEAAGLLSFHPTQTAAWGDFDNDGWLDVFIGNETTQATEPHPCQLFRNNGDGTFTDVARSLGLADLGFVKGVAWGDYDNDGWLDLYVSRKGEPNLLFRNTGRRGTGETPWSPAAQAFNDVSARAGVREPMHGFATWFWDYDNDGWLDLFVAGFSMSSLDDIPAAHLGGRHRAERPRLYRNLRNGTFEDVTRRVRLDRVILVMGANFGDLDNDGWLDVYLGTGDVDYRALLPNRLLRNDAGRAFQDVTTSSGTGHLQKGHGISFADFDNDGDQDVHVELGGANEGDLAPNVLFENPGHGHHWIGLALGGRASNRAALGARVRVGVRAPAGRRDIHRVVGMGSSFGGNPLRLEIGIGDAVAVEDIEVRWPSGLIQRLPGVPMDARYVLGEGGEIVATASRRFRLGGSQPPRLKTEN